MFADYGAVQSTPPPLPVRGRADTSPASHIDLSVEKTAAFLCPTEATMAFPASPSLCSESAERIASRTIEVTASRRVERSNGLNCGSFILEVYHTSPVYRNSPNGTLRSRFPVPIPDMDRFRPLYIGGGGEPCPGTCSEPVRNLLGTGEPVEVSEATDDEVGRLDAWVHGGAG